MGHGEINSFKEVFRHEAFDFQTGRVIVAEYTVENFGGGPVSRSSVTVR